MKLDEKQIGEIVERVRTKAIETGDHIGALDQTVKEFSGLSTDGKLRLREILLDRLGEDILERFRTRKSRPQARLVVGKLPCRSGKDAAAGAEAEERRESLDIPNPHERAS